MSDKIEGFLEVGCNEQNEIVVNHPDLKPDENGVGHIVFSVNQARNFARLLVDHADSADREIRRQQEEKRIASLPPVDRTAQTLTDGSPVTDDHRELLPSGQQKGYVVLSAEERAKGFVRPLRFSYRHVGIRPKYPLVDLTPTEHERYDQFGYVKFEAYPEGSASTGRYWTEANLASGCNRVTTMGRALAETYARDPGFYSGTFCCTCAKQFDLEQFVWEGTDDRLGS
jgi:hypothetical protein